MDCASCGRANRSGARFCGGCGRALAAACPGCGCECPPGAKFCDACGVSLAASPPDAARKIVTIVFADLVGSVALHERLDAESARRFMERYYAAMRGAVEAHGGSVTQLLGDGVKAVFGIPRVAEDDAIRAVRAAAAMQRAFAALAAEQVESVGRTGLRVAVNSGEVVAKDETEIIGDPVNVAARLQAEARDGDVVIGEATRRLVAELVTLAPLGSVTLRGRSEAVAAWRVVSLERPAGAAAIAFVGREDELRRVAAVYEAAVAARAARLAVVLGSPGLGKSRLIDEFARRLGDRASVLVAHCDAAGGATFAPLAEALRALLRIEDGAKPEALRAAIEAALLPSDPERARIASGLAALLAGAPASPEEIFFVVRRLLGALAVAKPVVLAIDDIQWAEPLLLDLIEHLVQWGSEAALLVLAAARPELRDTRSSLATPGGLVSDVVTLAGLDASESTRLAANVVGAEALPAAIAGRVLAASEGNPLFVGELVRMLVHDGALKREGDRWTTGVALADVEMPPTIHALLAARIERLRPEERTLLERAAVIGRHFSRASLAQLLPRETGDLDARLEALRRSELIESDTGWFLGEPALRFHHVLIRDAAYRRLLKHTRAELHGRFADWLEARAAGGAEHDELLGWHLEQAHEHLRELGPIDAHSRSIGERASRHLAAAGRRALARDDLSLAASLLERALAPLDAGAPARAELALDWCEAVLSAGDVAGGARAIAELGGFIGASDRLRAWHACFRGQLAVLTDPQALRASAEAVEAAAAALTALGDAAGEAKAHAVHALVLAQLGKIGASEAALDKALAAARRAQDRRRANAVLAGAPVAALWGPSPVTRASGRCLDVVRVLRITQGAPAVEAVALRCQAVLETLRGRADAARRMIATSRRMVEELGITQRVLEADLFAGLIELLEGDAAAAERCLRVAWDGLRAQGLGIDAAQAGALLGRALLAQGRTAEAEAISVESEALAGDSFKAAIAWRGVRAEALAARGEHARAIELARAAVEIAAATDDLLDHADARWSLAVALRAAGRGAEADAEAQRAIELWDAKGATLRVERARSEAGRSVRRELPPEVPAERKTPVRRRVRANAATAIAERLQAAIATQDTGALPGLLASEVDTVHHPTGSVMQGRRVPLDYWEEVLRAKDPAIATEDLASLGDVLALIRQVISVSGLSEGDSPDVGPITKEEVSLIEVDASGRCCRLEIFAPDHLGDAVVRLFERYAEVLPDGPARARAAATARSVAAALGPYDTDAYAGAHAQAIEYFDHRAHGVGALTGVEAVRHRFHSLLDFADDVRNRMDDVLDLRSDALLMSWTNFGVERASGGSYERHFLWLGTFGADGLLTRIELFEGDRDGEALARFDELTGELPSPHFANAAWRTMEGLERCWRERDWAGVIATISPTHRLDDRRRLVGAPLSSGESFASLRFVFDLAASEWRHELLATRGERLALLRVWLSGRTADSGPLSEEHLQIVEVDAGGRQAVIVNFELDDRDAAHAELDALHHAGEAAPHARVSDGMQEFKRAFTERDWDAITARCAPDLVVHDHRLLGWETLHGPAAYLEALRSLVELAPDTKLRIDHASISENGYLVITVWEGTREGGAYEAPSLMVAELDAQGRIRRFDQYDLDKLAEARARYAELRPDPLRIPPNAAARAIERWWKHTEAGELEGVAELLAPSFVFEDRRHLVRDSGDREKMLASVRVAIASGARLSQTLLATAGDRLALVRQSFSIFDGSRRLSEIDALLIVETDAEDRVVATVGFDPDDRRAAAAEMFDRWVRGEGARWIPPAAIEIMHALNDRDLERLRASLPDGFYFHDHRRTGVGRIGNADDYLASLRVVFEQSRDVFAETLYSVALAEHGALNVARMFGTLAEGGEFEILFARLIVFQDGKGAGLEIFEVEDLARARARFEAIGAERAAQAG